MHVGLPEEAKTDASVGAGLGLGTVSACWSGMWCM